MRVALFVEEDYDFLFPMCVELLRLVKERGQDEIVGLAVFPGRLAGRAGLAIPLYFLRLLGVWTFARLAARSALQRARHLANVVRGRSPAPTLAGLCRREGIAFRRFASPNGADAVEWIRSREVDVLLIFVGHVLRAPILQAARICVLNKHSSLLPAYRGLFPVFWARKHGHPVGITVHRVVERLDAGPILCQQACEAPGLSIYDHYALIYRRSPALLLEALDVAAGRAAPRTVSHDLPAGYHGLPTREDYREFARSGQRWI